MTKLKTSGFTLIELLIVVLIIGILTSVALPMYKKAAERSKATEALSTLTAVAKSEHDFFLTKNKYTQDFADLDIDLTDKNGNKAEDDAFKSQYYDYELLDSGIIADRNNGEYTLYKDYEDSQIICTPSSHYICENLGEFKKESCNKLGMAWASSNSTCYASDQNRCIDLYGDSMWDKVNKLCGYKNVNGATINDGMVCKAVMNNRECAESIVNSGGQCLGNQYMGCNGSTINNGGICRANAFGTCQGLTINSGGICEGKTSSSCEESTINSGGICEGKADKSCYQTQIQSGGVCKGLKERSCAEIIVYPGGECWALTEKSCGNFDRDNNGGSVYSSQYKGSGATSGCCRGQYCPDYAPRCECPNHEKKDSNGNCITA